LNDIADRDRLVKGDVVERDERRQLSLKEICRCECKFETYAAVGMEQSSGERARSQQMKEEC
jgi:hypothetical protein